MSRNRKVQSIVVLFALVAGMFVGAMPAQARVASATAGVDVTEVLAGESKNFVFDVTNTGAPAMGPNGILGAAAPSANWIRIRPEITGTTDTFLLGGIPDIQGWNESLRDADGDGILDAAIFRAETADDALAAGESLTLGVQATAGTLAIDDTIGWSVQLDDADGANPRTATPVGALETTIRVLKVDTVTVAGPVGVLDNTATAAQDNLTIDSTVSNHGREALTVDPSLASSTSGDTITDQGALEIAPGGTETFTFPVALSSATAARTFTGDASATGADAIAAPSAPLTVEAPAAFLYTGGSLSPKASVSGALRTFTLNLAKSNPPGVTLDLSNSVLTFTEGDLEFSTGLVDPASVEAGSQSLGLTFAPITIPGTPGTTDFDAAYTPSLVLEGIDTNGATVFRNVSFGGDRFEIDNLVPFVEVAITGPAGQIDADGFSVAKDGQTLDISGEIRKSAAPGAPLDPDATVSECWLVIEDGENAEISRTPIDDCTSSGGNISGSAVLDTAGLESGAAFVAVKVTDAAGNTTEEEKSAEFVLIDNLVPTVAEAVTGCGAGATGIDLPVDELDQACDPNSTIRVVLSEPVKGEFQPIDFAVASNAVLMAASTCTTETFCDTVVLTLADSFGDDDNPQVEYTFTELPLPVRSRPTDAPVHELDDAAVAARDGIVPALPDLATVTQDGLAADGTAVSNKRGAQGGSFYTNQETPTFAITGLGELYTAIVAVDTNDSGDFEPGIDRVVAECISEVGDTVDCQADQVIGGDGTYDLLIASRDADDNLSEGREVSVAGKHGRPATLVIDNLAPTAESFAAAGNDLTVAFSEDLAFGRDAGADWNPRDILPNGNREVFDVSGVTGTGVARVVTIEDTDYEAGEADELLYSLEATPNLRYQDRAGNYLLNFIIQAAT
jgi:hypothetical protein